MENATKALLIAAAILIAILIISLSLVVYNMAAEQVGNADLTEAEAASFNGKFTAYEGTNVSAANVKALLSTVLTSNQTENESGSKRTVTVNITSKDTKTKATLDSNSTSIPASSLVDNYYTVTCNLSKGLVSIITVQGK